MSAGCYTVTAVALNSDQVWAAETHQASSNSKATINSTYNSAAAPSIKLQYWQAQYTLTLLIQFDS